MNSNRHRLFISVFMMAAPLAAYSQSTLPNGVYAVLREGATRDEVRIEKPPNAVVPYEGKYLALDTSTMALLKFEGAPQPSTDERGRTMLNVTLAKPQARALEELTRAQLNRAIAVVVGGEVISAPKVRSVISDGKAKITGCEEDTCRALLEKLTR